MDANRREFFRTEFPESRLPFNPKKEIKAQSSEAKMAEHKVLIPRQITRMDTDYEEVVETISKPVWCFLRSEKSV